MVSGWTFFIAMLCLSISLATNLYVLSRVITPKADDVDDAIDEIAYECQRQVDHGYDAAHDDAHTDGELLVAAMTITDDVRHYDTDGYDLRGIGNPKWFDQLAAKVSTRPVRGRLAMAAAFIVAEMVRRRRVEAASQEGPK